MERLELKHKDAQAALKTLDDILREPYSVIVRDAAIQRFEYTFEAFWKFIKEYLKEKEGLYVNSPKSCFRELLSIGIASEDEVFQLLEMTDRRNETSHTYKEKVAQNIYDKTKGYFVLMDKILTGFRNKM